MNAQPHIVPFDTLRYAKRLQSANVPPEQAAIQAEALQETLGQAFQTAEIATRSDIERLDTKIDTQGKSLHAKIEAESNKIIIRIGGMIVAVLLGLEVVNRFWPKV